MLKPKSPIIRRINNLTNTEVLVILFTLFAGGSIVSLIINVTSDNSSFAEWGESWLQNFSTEMLGAFLTFILLTLNVGSRQERERLIRQMRSRVEQECLSAIGELRRLGYHKDGTLRGQYFRTGNMKGAYFKEADLSYSDFGFATLEEAYLWGANLEGADLWEVNLSGATLIEANLQGVQNIETAQFTTATILPDGTAWGQTDITRFTDPKHPNFWRSSNPESSAYGKK